VIAEQEEYAQRSTARAATARIAQAARELARDTGLGDAHGQSN
jgi:hypothetical protein